MNVKLKRALEEFNRRFPTSFDIKLGSDDLSKEYTKAIIKLTNKMKEYKCCKTPMMQYKDEFGQLHRENGPALFCAVCKREEWLNHGVLHRECDPAIVSRQTEEWYFKGLLHRADGPARIRGTRKEWWINGMQHRQDGPAVEHNDMQIWFLNDKLHRIDGPAMTRKGRDVYAINGTYYLKEEFDNHPLVIHYRLSKEYPEHLKE